MKTYHVDSTKTVVPIKGNDKVLKRKFDSIKEDEQGHREFSKFWASHKK